MRAGCGWLSVLHCGHVHARRLMITAMHALALPLGIHGYNSDSPTGTRMLLYVDANFASPYALVAFVSLIEKGLEFEIEPLDLAAHANHDPNFARTSITRRIPTLIDDGFALSESSAICEYIDETFRG